MRTVFVGAVEGSLRALEALIASDLTPGLVVTLPPAKAARHSDFCDIAGPATAAGSHVVLTDNINSPDALREIEAFAPDLSLVIGWSQICHARFRAIPSIGTIGFHPAPLPAFRGRAAIPWTILADLPETAATLFWIDAGCDTGDIAAQVPIPLTPNETARSLYDKQVSTLARMLPETVTQIAAGHITRVPQDHSQASYCARRRPEDGRIDWSQPAPQIARLIRAVGDPYPGAWSEIDGNRITIRTARVHEGAPKYIGLPGQIQEIDDRAIRISCGGFTCLEVTAWQSDVDRLPARHAILGQRQPEAAR